MIQRDEAGQFLPGESGNPSGRPRNESAEVRKLFAVHSKVVVNVVTNAALSGDLQACKLILERISPPLKAQLAPITVHLPNDIRMHEMAKIFIKEMAEGSLAPDVAAQMVNTVDHLVRIVAVMTLEDRIEALERSIKEQKS